MKAVIFDMDGVIIDSEPIHEEIERGLLEELGGKFDREFHHSLVGTTDHSMWTTYKKKFHLEPSVEEMVRMKKERFIKKVHRAPLVRKVCDLISILYDHGYPLALASSNNRKAVDAVIENFNLHKYFKFSISGEEVIHGKPHPEIFLTAAGKMGMDPDGCLVIEDAENGVLAAKAAGMKCIGFRNPNSGNQDLSKADLIIESFDGLNLDRMRALFLSPSHGREE